MATDEGRFPHAYGKIHRRFFETAFGGFLSAIRRKIGELKQKETPP